MSASTCLQKTLLFYATILLTIICMVWSRELSSPNRPLSSSSSSTLGNVVGQNSSLLSTDSDASSGRTFNDDGGGGGSRDGVAKRKHKNHHKTRRNNRHNRHDRQNKMSNYNSMDADQFKDLTMWISEEQVNMLSGYSWRVYAIEDGVVNHFVRDPSFNKRIPIIPSEVHRVNFTWLSGERKYYYHFDRLQSHDESILQPPTVSIKVQGRVSMEKQKFSVSLPCAANATGSAMFSIGLLISTRRGKPVPGTPIRLSLKKECAPRAPDLECDKTCSNHGRCKEDKTCQCAHGFMGQHCEQGLCFPQCMHGGNCTAPGKCSCPPGYQGEFCEGGICTEKCLNGGKCNQKDTCHCPKGYYGLRCEFSKCVIPCMNSGKCVGSNKCRCPAGWEGDHCEKMPPRSSSGSSSSNVHYGKHSAFAQRRTSAAPPPPPIACKKPCRHGTCRPNGTCRCDVGWQGERCHQRIKRRPNTFQ